MAAVKKSRGEGVTTRAGSKLTPDYERQLAEEAEAGFDPGALTRRRAGRPSLSGRRGRSNRLDLRVDDATYQAIRRLAEAQHRPVSDVLRDAIQRYLQAG